MSALGRRLARLEASRQASATASICVWCHDEAGFPAAVDQMIADGAITPDDRSRCVPWWVWRGKHAETHDKRILRWSRSS